MKLNKQTVAVVSICIFLTVWIGWVITEAFVSEINLIEDPSTIKWRGIQLSPIFITIIVLVLFLASLPHVYSLAQQNSWRS